MNIDDAVKDRIKKIFADNKKNEVVAEKIDIDESPKSQLK